MTSQSNHLIKLYTSYKDSTKYALEWIWSSSGLGTDRQRQSHSPSTQDIIDAANLIARKRFEVPQSVIAALTHTIKTRQQVGRVYESLDPSLRRGSDADGSRHRAFVHRLETALAILLPFKRAHSPPPPAGSEKRSKPETAQASNRYNLLRNKIKRLSQDSHGANQSTEHSIPREKTEPNPKLAADNERFLLKDDDLGGWIEVQSLLRGTKVLLRQLDDVWKGVGEGELPIPLAACLSMCAFNIVSREAMYLHEIVPHASALLEKCLGQGMADVTAEPDKMALGQQSAEQQQHATTHFRQTYQVLERLRCSEKLYSDSNGAATCQKPLDFIGSPHLTEREGILSTDGAGLQGQADDMALQTMLENIMQLNKVRASKSSDGKLHSEHFLGPLDVLVQELIENETEPIEFELVFRLELLLSSYKSFLWPTSSPTRRNCRIEALKLVQDIQKEIAATTVEFKNTLLSEVPSSLQDTLEMSRSYLEEKRFDLYSQAPLTAGWHMIQFLHCSFDQGLPLSTHFNHVSAVLHLYNAMRNIHPPIRSISVLDQLCELFRDALFHGILPKENFSSQFRITRGQKVTIRKNEKAIFERLKKKVSEGRRVSTSDMSIVFHLHESSYQITAEYLLKVLKAINVSHPGYNNISKWSSKRLPKDSSEDVQFIDRFKILMQASGNLALKEFTGDCPVALVNLMAIFRLCLRILEQLVTDIGQVAQSNERSEFGPPTDHALHYIDLLLENVVDFARDPALKPMEKLHHENLRKVRDAFAKIEQSCATSVPLWTI